MEQGCSMRKYVCPTGGDWDGEEVPLVIFSVEVCWYRRCAYAEGRVLCKYVDFV